MHPQITTTDEKVGLPHYAEDVESNSDKAVPGAEEASVPYSGRGSAQDKALVYKQDLRIVPLCSFIYLLCYLDRSNIGNAKVLNQEEGDDLLTETNMTNLQFTIALMVFLIAYALFEVPSNYMLKRMKPSNWIAFLMLSWGAITMGLGGVNSFGSVTAVRFLLGVFEAGLFPGLVCGYFPWPHGRRRSTDDFLDYLTFWYRTEERSLRVALILASATLAGAFGGAIAYGVGHMNQTSGLSAWRWLFILEGLPSLLSAVAVFFFLPDYPETAKWLSAEEKQLAADRLRLEGSHGHSGHMSWVDAKATLLDLRLYAHYAVYPLSLAAESLILTIPSRFTLASPHRSPRYHCSHQRSPQAWGTPACKRSL